MAALLLGADEYFTWPLHHDLVLAHVRRLINPRLGRLSQDVATTLTDRENEVLALLAAGRRSPEIAEMLCITKKTAATHIEHILATLGVHSQAQAVAVVLRDGLLRERLPAFSPPML